jgi:hydroxymethylpyrimidine pyrophosphatase-like HAD family hydrolase
MLSALATDYDGTIAWNGAVSESTVLALERWKGAGRKLILVTGRELPELRRIFPELGLFDRIVAENGGLLACPRGNGSSLGVAASAGLDLPGSQAGLSRLKPELQTEILTTHVLAAPPSQEFVDSLRGQGVRPLSVGEVIVSTQETFHGVIADTIAELGLDLRIILNKGALMVLPAQVNKASGLQVALHNLGISLQEVAAVGDAENDADFLGLCGYSVAVANAIPSLKAQAQFVTQAGRGAGVEELISMLLQKQVPV